MLGWFKLKLSANIGARRSKGRGTAGGNMLVNRFENHKVVRFPCLKPDLDLEENPNLQTLNASPPRLADWARGVNAAISIRNVLKEV